MFKYSVVIFIFTVSICGFSLGQQALFEDGFEQNSVGSFPTQWHVSTFRNTSPMRARIVRDGDGKYVCLDFKEAGQVLSSFYIHSPKLEDRHRNIEVSFRYKTNFPFEMVIGHSAAPGVTFPTVKEYMLLLGDGEWHKEKKVLTVGGKYKDQKVIEFFLAKEGGKIKKGDRLFLDDIAVKEIPIHASVKLINPSSLNLYDKMPSQYIALQFYARQVKQGFRVSITQEKEDKPIFEKRVAGSQKLKINFDTYKAGNYHVKVTAPNLQKIWNWKITKNPYKENSVVVCDGVPYVNGKPFLFLGLYHVSERVISTVNQDKDASTGGVLDSESVLRSIKDKGFNVILDLFGVSSDAFYSLAEKNKLLVISDVHLFPDRVKLYKNRPALFGFYIADEPFPSEMDLAEKNYHLVKKLDPYHPVMNCVWPDQTGIADHKLNDIAAVDKYPITGPKSSVEGDAFYVNLYRELRGIDDDPGSCIYIVPQLYAADNQPNKGYEPTIMQIRAQVYTSIVCGAKGVFYFSYWCPNKIQKGMSGNPKRKFWFLPESNLWKSIGELNRELMSIKDIILLGKPTTDIILEKPKSVLCKSVVMPGGQKYIIIANPLATYEGQVVIKECEKLDKIAGKLLPSATNNRSWSIDVPGYFAGVYKVSQ